MTAGNKRQRPKMQFSGPDEPPQPVEERRVVTVQVRPNEVETRQNSRVGKRAVTFYLSPDAFRQLGVLSAQTDRTIQDMMTEATDWLFQNHGLHRIAKE